MIMAKKTINYIYKHKSNKKTEQISIQKEFFTSLPNTGKQNGLAHFPI